MFPLMIYYGFEFKITSLHRRYMELVECDELINDIRTNFRNKSMKRPYLVGIDGLGGAGKTTLVHQLMSRLQKYCPVVIIRLDDHIVERNKRYGTGREEWYEYYYLQWDISMLTEELFMKIHENCSCLTLPFYDKSNDTYKMKDIPIPTNSIVIIEGVFNQRIEWIGYYDFTVFVDCPRDIRYERVLQRDTYIGSREKILDKYRKRYWLAEEHYLEVVKPEMTADKIYRVNS